MLSIGVLGISFKTADLALREEMARGSASLSGDRAVFFRHPIVLLSTCNRTEIYFSAEDLAEAHSDLLAYLRQSIREPFEHRLYSYFGNDCFAHLCKVAAGLDSAIVAETEIQRQVRNAYGNARFLPSCLHYAFQKALKVSKEIRHHFQGTPPTLYGMLWRLANWRSSQILLVGYSEINRGLISFLAHKEVREISLCTRSPEEVKEKGIRVCSRKELRDWQKYDVIVCATRAEGYLIEGKGSWEQILFDLSVPRNINPEVGQSATLYNIDQLKGEGSVETGESLIWEHVSKLSRIYHFKTQHALENAGMESHL